MQFGLSDDQRAAKAALMPVLMGRSTNRLLYVAITRLSDFLVVIH